MPGDRLHSRRDDGKHPRRRIDGASRRAREGASIGRTAHRRARPRQRLHPGSEQAPGPARLGAPRARQPRSGRRRRLDAPERARRRPGRARPAGVGAGSSDCAARCRSSASSSAPGPRPSPSACAGCASAPTTGSPSRATPRRSSRACRASCAAAAAPAAAPRPSRVIAGEVEIRSDRFQAFVGERSIDLTRREFELIELLAAAEGRVLEREEIYSRLWGYTMVRGDRSVDVFVRKLRQKLEKASPELALHPHPLRHRLPLRRRIARGRRPEATCPPQCPPTGTPGDQGELAGAHQDGELTAAPSRRTTASPPFFRSTRAPGELADDAARDRARGRRAAARPSAPMPAARRAPARRRSRRRAARRSRSRSRCLLVPLLGGQLRRLARRAPSG